MKRIVSIAVLAGGQSSRMGRDKALVELEPDQTPMLRIVLDRVASLSDDVFVVANRSNEYGRFGVRVLPDRYPGAAALGGIGSALRHATHDACLVIACDQPFINPDLMRAMLERDGDWDVLAPAIRGTSRQGGNLIRQTLHAIYKKTCLSAIEQAISDHRLQSMAFHDDVRVDMLDESFVRRYDPTSRSFFSVNTPEDLAMANKWRTEDGR